MKTQLAEVKVPSLVVNSHDFPRFLRRISHCLTLNNPRSEWSSYTQLIQELIGGGVKRNLFTQWELDLLLDLQMTRLRKSSRTDALRRYLRVVQQSSLAGDAQPLRFADFLAGESPRRAAAGGDS